MKRLGFLFAFALVGSMMAGCTDSGLKEGTPTETPKESMSDAHKAFMEANASKMQMKGKPKNMPKPAAPQ
jgi:hypothetical protein